MNYLLYLPLFALVGALTKFADNLADEAVEPLKRFRVLVGFSSGLIAGFLVSANEAFATVALAVIIGTLAFGRVDDRAHHFALAGVFASLAFFGFPGANIPVLLLFAFTAGLDEWLNEWADSAVPKGGKIPKVALFFSRYRLSLELAALMVSVVLLQPLFFLAIFSFDAAYIATGKLMKPLKQKN